MKKILIVNGHQTWESSPGKLNSSLVKHAKEVLEKNNCAVKTVCVENDWDNKEQVENFKWADIVIFQFPVFWFNVPWKMKKYIDDVYMEGQYTFFKNDGRVSENPEYNYGTGGLFNDKKYMISMTWNAPATAFKEKSEFFNQKSANDVLLGMHKANQFCGLKTIESFICYDVMKNPKFEQYLKDLEAHLVKHVVNS